MTLHDLIREATVCDHNAAGWISLYCDYRALKPTLTPEEAQLLADSGAEDMVLSMFTDVTQLGEETFNALDRHTADMISANRTVEETVRSINDLCARMEQLAGRTNE